MASEAVPQAVADTASSVASSSQSVWDRITTWASENKTVVYTIAGVTVVVTGAGLVYYLTPRQEAKASKKSKKKAKKGAEAPTGDEKVSPAPGQLSVTVARA